MTRVLAELLDAAQPRFGMTIRELERAAGRPSTDIRLTSEVLQRVQQKLKALQLDPHDTAPRELYRVLEERFGRDDMLVSKALGIADNASPTEVIGAVKQYVANLDVTFSSFALKPAVAKRILKKYPPKRAMKQLNYRSVDSMLKHENVAHIYVAALFCESMAWRKKYLEQYNKLQPKDFETRSILVTIPTAGRWKDLAKKATEQQRHNVFVVKEYGVVVILPLHTAVPGLATTTLVLLLNAINDIASTGSYLKLQQVKPDFGATVRRVAEHEPMTGAELVDRHVPWRVVHQYYARFKNAYNPVIFEPHVQSSDLKWLHPEALLAKLHPELEFWRDSRYSSFHRVGHQESVSLNILDVALNYCNKLPFAQRTTRAARQHLWHELMVRYLDHDNVERAISGELELQPEAIAAK